VASIGEDGILLVDTGEKETSEKLKSVLDTFGKGTPKIIINTHAHVDHTGGNAIFGKAPIIIAHEILRTRLKSGSYLFDEFPEEALPDITFTDSLSLYFNGEEIKVMAFPGSHDDNDVIVWLKKSGLVHLGDIMNGLHFPSIEEVTGNVLKFGEVVQKIEQILPDDVIIISGHGEDCTKKDLETYREVLEKTIEVVRKEVESGKDFETLRKERVLQKWESFGEGYVSTELWLAMLVEAFQDLPPKKTLYEPIYNALKEHGLDAAIKKYYDLKENHYDEYRFHENDLAFMADKLARHERIPEAIRFFELCAEEYPDGIYAWFYYYSLGKLYNKLGNNELAIRNYEKSIELNAENPRAVEKLEKLKKKKTRCQ
jgi:cyclase